MIRNLGKEYRSLPKKLAICAVAETDRVRSLTLSMRMRRLD